MAASDIKGISWPFRFGANGHIIRASGQEKLISNVKALILTRLKELPFEPEKGTAGAGLAFRHNQQQVVETLTRQALVRFEPRLLVRRLRVVEKDIPTGRALFVEVLYKIRDTQQSGVFELRVGGPA